MEQVELAGRCIVHVLVDCCAGALVGMGLSFGVSREKCVLSAMVSKSGVFCSHCWGLGSFDMQAHTLSNFPTRKANLN